MTVVTKRVCRGGVSASTRSGVDLGVSVLRGSSLSQCFSDKVFFSLFRFGFLIALFFFSSEKKG